MRKSKSWARLLLSSCLLLSISACVDDWGQSDPPAGVQTYVSSANLATLDFEDGVVPETFFLSAQAGSPETMPELVALSKDEDPDGYYGTVLHVNKGIVRVDNPYHGSLGMSGAAMTFYVKQVPTYKYTYEDDGETVKDSTLVKDLTSPLLCFKSEDGSQSVSITPNGSLIYSGAAGEYSANVIEGSRPTGLLESVGDWHWVSLQIDKDGYTIYSDGYKRIHETSTTFNYENIVDFITSTPYLYIGGDNDLYIDNITVRTNELTAEMTKDPRVKNSGGSSSFEYIDGEWMDGIGAEDCSTGWWSEFSPYFRIPANSTLTLNFENHTSGGGNWNNWNLAITTDDKRGGGNYKEFSVIRSDLYGWGDNYDGANWSNEGYGDWDAFRADMEGANVTVTISRKGDRAYVTAVAEARNGNVYTERFNMATSGDVIRAFLIVDGSYLKMKREGCSIETPIEIEKTTIGAEDCTAGWWSEFSDYFHIPANSTLKLKFENHTSGGGNWNNWNLAITSNDDRGGGNYKEFCVVRSDLYGWGDNYDGANWTNEGYGDWDAFRADMEGANVTITIKHKGEIATMEAVAVAKNNNIYKESFMVKTVDDEIRAFLIVDGSHLKMDVEGCMICKPL